MESKEYIEQEFALNRVNNALTWDDSNPESPPGPETFGRAFNPDLGYDAILAQGIHGPTQQNNLLSQLRSSMVMNQAPPIAPAAPAAPAQPTTPTKTETIKTPKGSITKAKSTKPEKQDWTIGEELASVQKTANTAVAAKLQIDPANVSSLFEIKGLIMGEDGKQVMSVNVKDPSILPMLKQMQFESGDKMFDPKNVVFGVEADKETELLLRKENPDLDIQRLPTPEEVKTEAVKVQAQVKEQDKEDATVNLSSVTGQSPEQVSQATDQGTLRTDDSGSKTTLGPAGVELATITTSLERLDQAKLADETLIAEWSKVDNKEVANEKIRQITARKSVRNKERNKLIQEKVDINKWIDTLSQYSTKDQIEALQVRVDESKGPVKATWEAGLDVWKENPTLKASTREQMMVGYENSANQTAQVIQDKASAKIYAANEALLRKQMNIPEDKIVIDFMKQKADSELTPEQLEAKSKLESLYWSGKSIPKELLQGVADYRKAKKAATTIEEAEALWMNIVGDEDKKIEGKPQLESFIQSEKAKLLVPAWELNNRPAGDKARLVDGAINLYQQGQITISELNQLKTDFLNMEAFGSYYKDWSADENYNNDSLIEKMNKAIVNE